MERYIGSKRELGFKTDGRESKGYVECTRLGGRAWLQYELNRDGGLVGLEDWLNGTGRMFTSLTGVGCGVRGVAGRPDVITDGCTVGREIQLISYHPHQLVGIILSLI